jgi:hypothetical protein
MSEDFLKQFFVTLYDRRDALIYEPNLHGNFDFHLGILLHGNRHHRIHHL